MDSEVCGWLLSFGDKMMWKSSRNVVTVLCTFALMVACGLTAFVGALTFLMNLGLKFHDNYQYYAGYWIPSLIFMYGSGALGFVVPGVIVWHLRRRKMQFSLGTMLIAMTVVAVIAAIFALSL